MNRRAESTLIKKQLITQHFNIVKRKLLLQLEIDQLHVVSHTQEDPEE